MPIEIKVVDEKEFSENQEKIYVVVRNDYCFEKEENLDVQSSVFAVLDYEKKRIVFESDDLEEFVSRLKSFEERYYSFVPGYLFNEKYLYGDDKTGIKFVRTVGLKRKERVLLLKRANREYDKVMARQLCFNF